MYREPMGVSAGMDERFQLGAVRDWQSPAEVLDGADPGQLVGRKLVAEACLVDLLAPIIAEGAAIPESLDVVARSGWTGWANGHAEASPGVMPPDERTLSRYGAELRRLTDGWLKGIVRELCLELCHESPWLQPDRPLNVKLLKKLLARRLPWIHRELVTSVMGELVQEGWFTASSRGYRIVPGAFERVVQQDSPPPLNAPGSGANVQESKNVSGDALAVRMARLYLDLFPALTSYVDLQPGVLVGGGETILTPDRLASFGLAVDAMIQRVLAPFSQAAERLPPEELVVFRLHRCFGVDERADTAEVPLTGSDECYVLPILAAAALPGWGDPDEAWRGLKGAVATRLQKALEGEAGGFFRAAHRKHGIGAGTLASYLDGPLLVSRKNGRIRVARDVEASQLEVETIAELSRAYPDSRGARWLWEHLSNKAELFSFSEYQALLERLVMNGILLSSRIGKQRYYRATVSHQSRSSPEVWERWQHLWRWLALLLVASRSVKRGRPGGSLQRFHSVVARTDLGQIETQIKYEFGRLFRQEVEPFVDLNADDHMALGGKYCSCLIFTRPEPLTLAQMEDLWDDSLP